MQPQQIFDIKNERRLILDYMQIWKHVSLNKYSWICSKYVYLYRTEQNRSQYDCHNRVALYVPNWATDTDLYPLKTTWL